MLTPKQLEHCPDGMVELYAQLESDILADMARRIATYDYFIPSAQWQFEKQKELGNLSKDIIKTLSRATGKSEDELRRLMSQAGAEALAADDEIYRTAGKEPPPVNQSKALLAVLNAAYKKNDKLFKNLTKTTARTATGQFEAALDRAHLQIMSGAFDQNTAIRNAVKNLSKQGIGAVKYPSGHTDTIEAAVRRATVTGVNQTCIQLQLARAEEMGCDLVETTAHGGARPEHAVWQGRVFSLSGEHGKYPDFYKSTGYGTGAGLGGWNCRHSFSPFFEGISKPAYSKAELKDYEAKKYSYNGVKMTEYEASQKQRYIERQKRRWKRENAAMAAAGLDTSESAAKIAKWSAIEKDFCRQTGLKRQAERSFIGTKTAGKGLNGAAKSGIIKNIDLDDLDFVTYNTGMKEEVVKYIGNTVKELEQSLGVRFNYVSNEIKSTGSHGTAIFQTEPVSFGRGKVLLQLNINTEFLAGKSIADIDKMFKEAQNTVVNSTREALIHECGHAKLIKGLTGEQIVELYKYLSSHTVKDISFIANKDGAEAIAEIEVLLTRNEIVSDEAKDFYNKHIGRSKIL